MGFDLGEELAGLFTGGATFLATGNPMLAAKAYDITKDAITTKSEIAERQLAEKAAQPKQSLPSVNVAKTATNDIQNVLSPTFARSEETISDLLSKARQELRPQQATPYQEQLEGVLSGDIEISDLPQFKAQERTLRNILASQGLSQSETATMTAFQPLVSSVFEDVMRSSQLERQEQRGISRDIADIFRLEAGKIGDLPIKQAELELRKRGLNIEESQFQTQIDEAKRIRKDEEDAALFEGIFDLGMEYGPDIIDFFSDGGTSDTDYFSGEDYFIP